MKISDFFDSLLAIEPRFTFAPIVSDKTGSPFLINYCLSTATQAVVLTTPPFSVSVAERDRGLLLKVSHPLPRPQVTWSTSDPTALPTTSAGTTHFLRVGGWHPLVLQGPLPGSFLGRLQCWRLSRHIRLWLGPAPPIFSCIVNNCYSCQS